MSVYIFIKIGRYMMGMEKPYYRKDIDGLRAVAVLAVIFYHAGFMTFFGGGYIGVDIFFVISGYIITRINRYELDYETWSIINFYERRFRRILPPLFFMLVICLAMAWICYDLEQMKQLFRMLKRVVFGAANFFLYKNTGGYFDAPEEELPLLHTWSLSVEEQFYVFLPILLWSIRRFRNKAYYTVWTVLFLAVCSVALSAYVVTFDAKFDFYMLPTRAFELLLGSSLAFVEHDGKRFFAPWCYLFGLAVVFFCIFGFGRVPKESFPGLWALLPCIGTALCIYGGTSAKETWAGRILSGRVMAGIGLISYSLYLYHWPFLVFFRQTSLEPVSGTWELLPVFGAVFALSCLSYFFVEQPIRKKRVLRTRRVLFTAAFACVLAFFLLGHFGRKYITPYVPDGAETYLLEEREWDFVKEHAFLFDGVPVARLGSESRPFSFLVLGDSHAAMLAHAVSEEASEHGLSGLILARGGNEIPVALPSDDESCRKIMEKGTFKFVLLSFRWTFHLEQCDLAQFDDEHSDTGEHIRNFSEKLTVSIEYMLRQGVRNIYILKPVPAQTAYYPASKAIGIFKRGRNPEDYLFSTLEANLRYGRNSVLMLERIAAAYPQVHLLDPVPYLCFEGKCPALHDKRTLYTDDDHLSVWGTALLKPLLRGIFAREVQFQSISMAKCPAEQSGARLRRNAGVSSRSTSEVFQRAFSKRNALHSPANLPCLNGIGQEHGNGHGADTAGHGSDGRALFGSGGEIHITAQACPAVFLNAVDAHVDDDRAGFEHIGGDETGASQRCAQNVGGAAFFREIGCAGMAHGHGGVAAPGSEQQSQRAAYQAAAAHDHGLSAAGGDMVAIQQAHDAGGRAGLKAGPSECQ